MRSFKKTLGVLILLAIIAIPLVGWWKTQAIEDWLKLRNYTPPASIAALAKDDGMTPQAKHDFYVNHPQLIRGVAAFREDCPESEQAIVLGCYHPVQNGIYVFNVSDSRLAGVQQVTAAHEMLHAAYDRLSTKDRNYVDGLLQDYYKHDLTDRRIKDEINSYKKTEPNDVVNEMHSVFGTEAPNLPTPLENYYKRYFINRSSVVAYAEDYQQVFTMRQAEIDADKIKLDDLHTTITNEEQSLQQQLGRINSDRARLDSERASGQTDQYNAGVPAFNAEVDAYNAGVNKLKNDISEYNSIVNDYNSLAGELRSLEKSIDTRLAPQVAQ
ncbi:MAG TPA: hypothetical protein VG964_01640 [Candidatus Saccharimonadales bacterium]|nr:hypothetical protein [Candidatus Saccharimonadales bacterium]